MKNCHGGSAKAVLSTANKIIKKYKRVYLGFIIWFDKDTCSTDTEEVNIREQLKQRHNVKLLISDPCVEHWLLAHFQTINLAENQTCKHYEAKLKYYIEHYKKNNCHQLEQHLDLEKVNFAIQNYPEIGAVCQQYFLN